MDIRLFIVYSLTIDVVFSVTTVAMNKWTRHKTFDNFITKSGLARSFDVGFRGIHDCLTGCSREALCVSAFYISQSAKCAMEDHVADPLEELIFRQGSTYFIDARIEERTVVPTTTLPLGAPLSMVAPNTPPISLPISHIATTTPLIVTTTTTVATTTTPIASTTTPVATTTEPVVTTTWPVVTTIIPVVTTTRPVVTTTIPILTTTRPVEPTTWPVVTTTRPVEPTTRPVITTTIPVVTTTPVFATTPPIAMFACPDSSNVWHIARLSDGSRITYKLVKHLEIQAVAKQVCIETGGQLLTIVKQARFDYFRQLLMTCPEINTLPPAVSVWIDGSNLQAGNRASTDAYRTVTGRIMFTNSGLWATDKPSDPYVENCVVLDHLHNYYMNDEECNVVMWYFCELSE